MKAKVREEKRNLSISELQAELRASREKQFKLRFKHRVTPLANPMELQTLRRHIARLETWIREKSAAKAQGGE